VVITRERHPFEGYSLGVIHSIRRRGVCLVLVILPNGSRSLIPVAWTDWNTEQSAGTSAGSTTNSHTSRDLGRIRDLLHLRKIIYGLAGRYRTFTSKLLKMPGTPLSRSRDRPLRGR